MIYAPKNKLKDAACGQGYIVEETKNTNRMEVEERVRERRRQQRYQSG